MTTGTFVESTSQATRGGFQGIKSVRGLLTEMKLVPPRFTDSEFGEPKNQIEFTLEDAEIVEMFEGEEEFPLKESKFVGWVTYAAEGKTPHANSGYMKVFVASAEEQGKKPTDFKGQVVTMEKMKRPLFEHYIMDEATKKAKLDADGNKIKEIVYSIDKTGHPNVWGFASEVKGDSPDIKAHLIDLLDGTNAPAALRKLMNDPKAKQFPEYKNMLKAGTLAENLGMTLVDGKFTKVVS